MSAAALAADPGMKYPASSEVSDQKAGSVLVYNYYTSGATTSNNQNTRINITNTSSTATAFVHLFFVAEGCSVADFHICLTPNQTGSFLASDVDPGVSGYIVAIAEAGSNGWPIIFNHLIGDEYVKTAAGHAANLGAEAFAALGSDSENFYTGTFDPNSPTAVLNFNGTDHNYNQAPAVLAASNIPSRADGNDTLIILNRFGGNLATGASTIGTIFGLLYDDAENAISFSLSGSCQKRFSISNAEPRTVPRFETYIPAGRSGWMKIGAQSGTIAILGSMINANANAAAKADAFNGGHNLHKLTLVPSTSLTIPIFPPSCGF
jgi:hypothetical protein